MDVNLEKNTKELVSSEILKELNIGLWAMEIVNGKKSKMFLDSVAANIMGCSPDTNPEDIYDIWFSGIDEDNIVLIKGLLDCLSSGNLSEVQYNWTHPDGSRRVIRCGGRRDFSFSEGIRLEGTHREVGELDHFDDEWRQRSNLLKSYFNYYNSRDALAILLVNMDKDRYATIKTCQDVESRNPLHEEGSYSRYIHNFYQTFGSGEDAESILQFQDQAFLEDHFKSSPVYYKSFSTIDESEGIKWFMLTANKVNKNEMVVSLEDRTQKVSEEIIFNSILSKLVGGFIFNLEKDIMSVVKLTTFFNYLDDIEGKISIDLGVQMLCPHIEKEFREGWKRFTSRENLMSVYKTGRRADFQFKAIFAGKLTWLTASIYSADSSISKDASVALVFRRFSKEELEETLHNEEILHQKEDLEKNYRLIKGIAAQYVSLKVVQVDGRFSVIYKNMDQTYGWDVKVHSNFWDAYSSMIQTKCHPEDLARMTQFSKPEYVVSIMHGRRRHLERFRFKISNDSYIWMDLVFIRFDKSLNTTLTEFAYGLANVDMEVNREREYKLAMEQVRISKEESRLKTQFVNNISHDIRTPLNAVIGYSQLLSLSDGQLSDKEREEYISYIETSGEMLTMLIDDILCISDIEHNILKIRNETCSCNFICRKAVSCCMMKVPMDVKLYFSSHFDDNFSIYSDSRRIQQILINMISNSCKATTRGEIRLACGPSSKAGFIDFAVSDTGCGVTPEKADEIFHRYVSVDNNERGKGHGLGLDICKQLSQRMGGYIWLDKEYKGGARFVLTLPIADK